MASKMKVKVEFDTKKVMKNIKNQIQSNLKNQNFEVECPKCNHTFKTSPGKTSCPKCAEVFDFELKLNL